MKRRMGQRGRTLVAVLVAGGAIGALAACASLLDIDSDRIVVLPDSSSVIAREASVVDSGMPPPDVVEEAPEYSGIWSCLNDPPAMFVPNSMTNVQVISYDSLQAAYTAQKIDGGSGWVPLTYVPLTNIAVRSCGSILYPNCDTNTNSAWEVPDEAGVTSYMLQQSFDGFFEVESEAGLFTTLDFPSPFVPGEAVTPLPGPWLTLSAVEGLEFVLPNLQLSLAADGGVGHVLVGMYDCYDRSAEGVYIVPNYLVDAGPYPTTIFYTTGTGTQETPSTTTTSTDVSGAAGILNAPVGTLVIRAYLKSTNQLLAVVNLLVKPGTATDVQIRTRTLGNPKQAQ
jgi:hypothetical protein